MSEILEIHSKDFLIKWINAPSNSVVNWNITPLKKSINFSIYKKNTPNDVDISDSTHDNERSDSLSSVINGLVRTKSKNSFSSELSLIRNYDKLLAEETVKGKLNVTNGGMFAFIFDNSFSKTISKKVKFENFVEEVKGDLNNSSPDAVSEEDPKSSAGVISSPSDSKNGESLQGVLLKRRRKKLQGFTKRYFILSFKYGTLSYFKSNDSILRGQMPIKHSIISANSTKKEFIIDSGMEIWDLKAQNIEDFNTWINAFNKIKKQSSLAINNDLGKLIDEEDGTQYVLDELENIVTKLDDLRIKSEDNNSPLIDNIDDIYDHVCDLIDQINPPSDSKSENGVYILNNGSYSDYYSDEEAESNHNSESSYSDDDFENTQLGAIVENDEVNREVSDAAEDDLYPLPHAPVERILDLPPCNHTPPNVLGIIRKNIGKDLTSIPLPVLVNEPLTILQRNVEKLEYITLVDDAISLPDLDDGQRILRIAAFVVSTLSGSRDRERSTRKPFNPLLGESYELVREDLGFRSISEKVCHRPPIFASHTESKDWIFTHSPSPHQSFWGKNAEIVIKGVAKIIVKKTGEIYSWETPTSLLKNIIVGEKYLEPSSQVTIKSSKGHKAVIDFDKSGMFSGRSEGVKVTAFDSSKKQYPYTLAGKWTESLLLKSDDSETTIWKVSKLLQPVKKKYGYPEFVAGLNKTTKIEEGFLPPTDSRLRPDLIAYEKGDVDTAEEWKLKLEEDQRIRRAELEKSGKEHETAFFTLNAETGDWLLKKGADNYWTRRKNSDWSNLTKLW